MFKISNSKEPQLTYGSVGRRAASDARRAPRRAGAQWTSTGSAGAGCCSPSSRRGSRTSAVYQTCTVLLRYIHELSMLSNEAQFRTSLQ